MNALLLTASDNAEETYKMKKQIKSVRFDAVDYVNTTLQKKNTTQCEHTSAQIFNQQFFRALISNGVGFFLITTY